MQPRQAPVKTADGYAELSLRTRGLSQRHRTLLLLVDGVRSSDDVRRLSMLAGVPENCFDQLLALGLIAESRDGSPSIAHVEVPLVDPGPSTLTGESGLPSSLPGVGWHAAVDEPDTPLTSDSALEQARAVLVRAVRNEAPVSGALTVMKLQRALTRGALEALFDEVDLRLRKPRKQIIAAQTLRHARHLLSLPSDSDH